MLFSRYKLVPGIAESSYGTQVAALAGIPRSICERAQKVAHEFALDSKSKQETRKQSRIPVSTLADLKFLIETGSTMAEADDEQEAALLLNQLNVVREEIARLRQGQATKGLAQECT